MESHLLQMRGLKQIYQMSASESSVASFTDAWIETIFREPVHLIRKVASFTDAWIETQHS